jgi:hypothetical protein
MPAIQLEVDTPRATGALARSVPKAVVQQASVIHR